MQKSPEILCINLRQINHAVFLNIEILLKVSYSQDCNYGIKGKDANIKRDFTYRRMKKSCKIVIVAVACVILISSKPQLCVVDCQIVENGIRITDLWLKFLFDYFPQYFPGQLMTTPILFLPQVNYQFQFYTQCPRNL